MNGIKIERVATNFQYPEIKDTDYLFGSAQVVGEVLRPDGDWRPYLPPEELQRRNGVESSACFIEAQQHSLATIQEEQFGIKDQNYSARFNLNFASASPSGGDPLKGAQTFRDYGLIPDSLLPFSSDIESWEEFNSFKGGDKSLCLKTGKEWRGNWEPKYDIAIRREESVQTKYKKLKEVLKYCPPLVSVFGWAEKDGVYVKPPNVTDNHAVELAYIDDNSCPYIWDTYAPFLKKLEPFYNFDFGLRWTLGRKEVKKKSWCFPQLIYRLLN